MGIYIPGLNIPYATIWWYRRDPFSNGNLLQQTVHASLNRKKVEMCVSKTLLDNIDRDKKMTTTKKNLSTKGK